MAKKVKSKKHDVYVEKKRIDRIFLLPKRRTTDLEWIVEGESGRWTYPETWPESVARNFYEHGWPFQMNLAGSNQ